MLPSSKPVRPGPVQDLVFLISESSPLAVYVSANTDLAFRIVTDEAPAFGSLIPVENSSYDFLLVVKAGYEVDDIIEYLTGLYEFAKTHLDTLDE